MHHVYDPYLIADNAIVAADCCQGHPGAVGEAGAVYQNPAPFPAVRSHAEAALRVIHPAACDVLNVFMVKAPPVFLQPYLRQRFADPLGGHGSIWIEDSGIADAVPECRVAVRLRRCDIIAQQRMERVLIGVPNGIHCPQDSGPTDEAVIEKDVAELEDQQGPLFPPILDVFAPPALCRLDEVGGGRPILAGPDVVGKHPAFPVTENPPLLVKDPAQVDGFALDC